MPDINPGVAELFPEFPNQAVPLPIAVPMAAYPAMMLPLALAACVDVIDPVAVNGLDTVTNEPVSEIVEFVKPPVVVDHFGNVLIVPVPVTATTPSTG